MKNLTEKRIKKLEAYGLNEYQIAEIDRLFPAVKRALLNNKVYATVHKVSQSGMSRTISLYIINKGEIQSLDWAFGKIYGDSITKDREVRINGCGMDMLFEANYRLFKHVFPRKAYQRYCRYREM